MLRNVGDEMNSSLVPIQWKSSLLSATEWHSIFRRRQLGVQEAHLLSCHLVPPPRDGYSNAFTSPVDRRRLQSGLCWT